jgi:hypothetical protein
MKLAELGLWCSVVGIPSLSDLIHDLLVLRGFHDQACHPALLRHRGWHVVRHACGGAQPQVQPVICWLC